MEWKKPVCRLCDKAIEKIADAVYLGPTLHGDIYSHVACYAKKLEAEARVSLKYNAIPLRGGLGRAIAKHDLLGTVDDAKSGNREKLQRQASRFYPYGIVLGLVLSCLGAAGIAASRANATVLMAAAVFLLMGILLLAAGTIGVLKTRQLERQVKKNNS
ncbi:MAG: hypothetical protein WC861_04170 [Candidatus Micrarchaeia archaeon]|jgi:hypothetical protein